MVVAIGEFGRTPKINPAGGRDHWPQCWTVLLAGGPIKGGQVVGASDDIGRSRQGPARNHRRDCRDGLPGARIDLATELPGPQSRPLRLVDHGVEPIQELF